MQSVAWLYHNKDLKNEGIDENFILNNEDVKQQNLVEKIRLKVKSGKVAEPFRAVDFDFLIKSKSFISKHAVGNGKYSEYFVRVTRGRYELK